MNTKLTPEGQRLADALVKAGVVAELEPYMPDRGALNAAALLLTAPEGEGAGLREAVEDAIRGETYTQSPDVFEVRGIEEAATAVLALLPALASPQPAVEGPVAAGVGDIRRAFEKNYRQHRDPWSLTGGEFRLSETGCGYASPHIQAQFSPFASGYRAAEATLTPAAPKTPDAATGGSVGAEAAEKDAEESYQIGKRDGYDEGVQDAAIRVGLDGEYRASFDPVRDVPDASTMLDRIQEQYEAVKARAATGGSVGDGGLREAVAKAFFDIRKGFIQARSGSTGAFENQDCAWWWDADDLIAGPLAQCLAQPAPVGEDDTGVREEIENAIRSETYTQSPDVFEVRGIEEAATAILALLPSLAPQPPKAETPAGVNPDMSRWAKLRTDDCDHMMQITAALHDLSEGYLEEAGIASASGEKNYELRDMHAHNILMRAANGMMEMIRTLGPEGYFPRLIEGNHNLLTTARDHIRTLERQIAALSTAPAARPGDEVSGFVLVPTKITHAMADDLFRTTWPAPTLVQAQRLWDAALAAAPAADGGRA